MSTTSAQKTAIVVQTALSYSYTHDNESCARANAINEWYNRHLKAGDRVQPNVGMQGGMYLTAFKTMKGHGCPDWEIYDESIDSNGQVFRIG